MKFKIKYAEQITGLFILIAIGFLALILIFMGINQRWFKKDYYFSSKFSSGASLKKGMDITLRGFQIGAVDDVVLLDDNTVEILFHIYSEHKERVKVNSVLELSTNPLGIGGGLVFYPGKTTELLLYKSENVGMGEDKHNPIYIPSSDTKEGKTILQSKLADKPEGSDAINQTIRQVQDMVANLQSITYSLDQTLKGDMVGPVGDLFNKINGLIASIREAIERLIPRIDQTLATAETTIDNLKSQLEGITSNLTDLTGKLNEPGGFVKTLLDPKGSVATLLDDDNRLFDSIQNSINSVTVTIENVNGILEKTGIQVDSLLVSVGVIADNIKKTTVDLGEMTNRISDIFNVDLKNTLKSVDGTIADLRTTINQDLKGIFTYLQTVGSNIVELSEAIKDPQGLIPTLLDPHGSLATLLNDDNDLYGRITGIIESVQTTIAGIGTQFGGIAERVNGAIAGLNTAITSVKGLIDNVRNDLGSLDAIMATVENATGNVEDMSEDLSYFTQKIRDPQGIVKTLLDPQGSIGTLLNDQNELYNSIKQIITSLQNSVDTLKEFINFVNSTSPQITGILEEGRDTLDKGKDVAESLTNNPLLKGGIPEEVEQQTTFQGVRDEDF